MSGKTTLELICHYLPHPLTGAPLGLSRHLLYGLGDLILLEKGFIVEVLGLLLLHQQTDKIHHINTLLEIT